MAVAKTEEADAQEEYETTVQDLLVCYAYPDLFDFFRPGQFSLLLLVRSRTRQAHS